jgi:hypothetical protein
MKNIIKFGFITNVLYNSTIIYMNNENFIKSFLYKINEGSTHIIDKCEILDDTYSIITGTNKPYCYYNISYVNGDDIIVNYIDHQILEFFKNEKKKYCKKELIECGELTILIKLFNLINNAIYLSINNQNINDLILNLNIINFDELYYLYKSSLNNIEILTNITLYKNKANVILYKEKTRLNKLLTITYSEKLNNYISIFITNPFNNICYNSLISSKKIIYNLLPDISFEQKLIILFIFYIYFKKKY